jgi:5,10-methylenetetrahydromethanopterin reductase
VLVTAAATAHVERLAPGRLTIGVGTGFTGSRALGQKAMKWADVAAYVEALRALVRGETVQWEGAAIRLMHPEGFGAKLPIEVPIVIAAEGPKGVETARRLADGLFVSVLPAAGFDWAIRLAWGTVLHDGEDPLSDRVFEVAGPAASVLYHGLYEYRGAEAVAGRLPNGAAWVERIEATPEAVSCAVRVTVELRPDVLTCTAPIGASGSTCTANSAGALRIRLVPRAR